MPDSLNYASIDLTQLLSDRTVQQLLDIVDLHPEWSIEQIINRHPANAQGQNNLTYNQARTILNRLNLSTVARRQLRSLREKEWREGASENQEKFKQALLPEVIDYLKYRMQHKYPQVQQPNPTIPITPQPSPAKAPLITDITPTQQQTFKTFDKFFNLTKQFSITVLLSFLFFFLGSLGFDTIFKAETILVKIGMFFAFMSLSCGMLFFLYSLKYYLTIAVVLSFSADIGGISSSKKGIKGFLESIFGIAIEVTAEQTTNKSSLSYDTVMNTNLERQPFISIHVGTYNEKRVIDRFLLAATSMEYDNYEVIVADDSTDETVELLKQWEKHPRVKISHRATRSGYKGGALIEALKKVDPRTEFILIFDADFIPYPDSISQFLKYFQYMIGDLKPETIQKSNIAAIQGYQWHVLNKSENWITRGIRSEYSGSYVIERSGTQRYYGLEQISGSVYMIRKNVLEQIGWGTSITEDFELTLKLYEKGYKVLYTPYLQAPAEAVSTVKRLIRQRMRWAEGHSFNIKRMFRRLIWGHWETKEQGKIFIKSPLTLAEKLEFIYLAPYYLQAFFFILGTLCWFTSEIIFRTRLPFWTETWGWSLVFTNLFALPLMNLVGLFMENAEERDYVGLVSFIVCSYFVAPFQAFAAVKGFLEKEEGPWFRTPKTGRITDSFVPSRFYRFVKGILGQGTFAQSIAKQNANPSLLLATANNRFDTFHVHPKKATAFVRIIVVLLIITSMLINSLAFGVKPAEAWYNNNYTYRKLITVDHTKIAADGVTIDTPNLSSQLITSSSANFSWVHTVGSQNNRLLVVQVNPNHDTNPTLGVVTYHGLAMTQLAAKNCTNGASSCRDEVWYLKNPPQGTFPISVKTTSSAPISGTAETFYNVDQTTPFDNSGTATTTNVTGTTFSISVPSTTTDLVADWYANQASACNTFTLSSGQTKQIGTCNTIAQDSETSTKLGAASTTTMSWTWTTSQQAADIGIGIRQATATDLTNFPVLVSYTDTALKTVGNGGHVQNASGFDIVFANTSDVKLDHEIEKYVASTGEIEMWVRIPTLSASSDTTFYIYYGNAAISTSQENITGVWDSNYKAVWHLNQGTGTNASDSTSNALTATQNNSPTQGSGQIDGSLAFDQASSQYLSISGSAANITGDKTVETWIKPTTFATQAGASQRVIFNNMDGGVNVYQLCTDPTAGFVWQVDHSSGQVTTSNNTTTTTGIWYHVVGVYTAASHTLSLYINGSLVPNNGGASGFGTATTGFNIARRIDSTGYVTGSLDEIRISNAIRTGGWIGTSYNNHANQGTGAGKFISTLGTEETVPEFTILLLPLALATPFIVKYLQRRKITSL